MSGELCCLFSTSERGFGNRNPKGLNKVLLRKMAIWRFTIRKDSIKEVRGRETCILVKGLF